MLAADSSDRDGGTGRLRPLAGTPPRLQVIWVAPGSDGTPYHRGVTHHRAVCLDVVTPPWSGMRGVWAPEGVVMDWDTIMPTGVPVLPRRWVVERTTVWITHHRRRSGDGEGTQTSSEAVLSVALTTLMVARRTRAPASAVSFCTHSDTNVLSVVQP